MSNTIVNFKNRMNKSIKHTRKLPSIPMEKVPLKIKEVMNNKVIKYL